MKDKRTFEDFRYDLLRKFPGFADDSPVGGGDLVEWLSEYIEELEPVAELATYHIEGYRLCHIWERVRFDVTVADNKPNNMAAKEAALKFIEDGDDGTWDYELGEQDSCDPTDWERMQITLKEA